MKRYIAAAVDELYELGIREAVVSPGSRSTPLSMLFCEHNFEVYMDIDERSAGFFALGIAKEKRRPVVLVCTSGSACAHYYPAVTEAWHSRIPLIILTADRPPELRNTATPQTINQQNVFGNFVIYYEELAVCQKNSYIYARNVMQKAFLACQGDRKGPVQINVPLREPLVPDLNPENFQLGKKKNSFVFVRGERKAVWDSSVLKEKNGIIVCGGDADSNYQEEAVMLAHRLKAPLLADPISNVRSRKSSYIIDSYDAFLKSEEIRKSLSPEYIIMLGQPPVSKRLQKFLAEQEEALCIQVDSQTEYRNPGLTTNIVIQASPEEFLKTVTVVNIGDAYLRHWQEEQKKMRQQLNSVDKEETLFEGKVVHMLQKLMPEHSRLVSANSMSIRELDYFWEAEDKQIKVLCNRGTNGIDGTISTALGIAQSGYPTVLVTGDLAFYHDLNGLLTGKTHHLNLIIVLFNNDGGGIFQYLPQKGEKYFEYLFCTHHGMNFKGLKDLYGIHYYKPDSYEKFFEYIAASLGQKGISIIEICTNMEVSRELHKKYTTPGGWQ